MNSFARLPCDPPWPPSGIPGGKPGKDGSEALQRYCDALSDDVVTLIHLPRLDRQQQQSGWFTALDTAGVTIRVDPVERKALPQWIAQRLAAQQGLRRVGGVTDLRHPGVDHPDAAGHPPGLLRV